MPDRSKPLLAALALGLAVLTGPTLLAAWTGPPVAAPLVDRLETEGYGIVEVRRSWLGRIVILADRDGLLREIVLNRATGTVLSDRTFGRPSPAPGAAGTGAGAGPATSGQTAPRGAGSHGATGATGATGGASGSDSANAGR